MRALRLPNNLLSDKDVVISNIAWYCDKILYACSPQDNRPFEAERWVGQGTRPRRCPQAIHIVRPVAPSQQADFFLESEAAVKESNNGLDDLLQRLCFQDTDLCDHETPIGGEELPGT